MFANGKNNKLNELNLKNKYVINNYELNLNDDNDSHSIICNAITNDSTVLDVGFGQGAISKCLIKDKKCIVDGVETDAEAIRIAEGFDCFRNIYKDVSELTEKYDYIIFADVLEHVYNPIDFMNSFSKYLKKDGQILISIPNVSYYDVIVGLINNNFNYDLKGILDNTHIRFFTENSFYSYIYEYNKTGKIKYDCELITTTTCNPVFEGRYSHMDEIMKSYKHPYNYQYIFKLNIVKSEKDAKNLNRDIKRKVPDFFGELDTIIDNYINKINILESEKNKLISNHSKEVELINIEHANNIKVLKEDIDKLNNEIKYILNSKSWKITKPLRWFMKLFKRS